MSGEVPYRRTFVRLLGFLRPYRWSLVVSVVLAAASQGASIALALLTRSVIDEAIRPRDRAALWLFIGLIVALGLATIPLPGPGWLTVIAGLVVLASEFTWAERLLEFTKRHVRRWSDWVKAQPVWVRLLIALATAAFVYGVVVVTLRLTGVPDWVPGWVPLWR